MYCHLNTHTHYTYDTTTASYLTTLIYINNKSVKAYIK